MYIEVTRSSKGMCCSLKMIVETIRQKKDGNIGKKVALTASGIATLIIYLDSSRGLETHACAAVERRESRPTES